MGEINSEVIPSTSKPGKCRGELQACYRITSACTTRSRNISSASGCHSPKQRPPRARLVAARRSSARRAPSAAPPGQPAPPRAATPPSGGEVGEVGEVGIGARGPWQVHRACWERALTARGAPWHRRSTAWGPRAWGPRGLGAKPPARCRAHRSMWRQKGAVRRGHLGLSQPTGPTSPAGVAPARRNASRCCCRPSLQACRALLQTEPSQ